MRKVLPRVAQHVDFAFIGWCECGVPAFAAQRNPAVTGRDQTRHANAGPRPQQTEHTVRPWFATADLMLLRVVQIRQRHRQRGEVVHDKQRLEPQRTTRGFDGEVPVAIGHADFVALDGIGNRNRRVTHGFGVIGLIEIGADDFRHAGIIVAGVVANLDEIARCNLKREPGVGAANVGEQPGATHMRGIIPHSRRHRS